VFLPVGVTRCTDGGALLHAKYHPHRRRCGGVEPKFLKQISKYKRLAPAHPSHDFFTKFSQIVGSFVLDRVKIKGGPLKGSYGSFHVKR